MTFYDEYVGHMLRTFYAEIAPEELTEAAKINCAACQKIVSGKTEQEQDILREVFSKSKKTPVSENVRKSAVSHGVPELDIWKLARLVTKEIARERGLI